MATHEELPDVIDYQWPDPTFMGLVANYYGLRRVTDEQPNLSSSIEGEYIEGDTTNPSEGGI